MGKNEHDNTSLHWIVLEFTDSFGRGLVLQRALVVISSFFCFFLLPTASVRGVWQDIGVAGALVVESRTCNRQ
jgi:hypothetical protein